MTWPCPNLFPLPCEYATKDLERGYELNECEGEAKMLERMKALAKEKDICVLATASGSNPYCSLMAYVTDDACREI